MKLRLKENTIRIRLNKDDLNMLQTKAEVMSSLHFPDGRSLAYGVVLIDGVVRLDFENDQLTLAAPRLELENWSTSEKVSFSWSIELEKEKGTLEILLEKDFPCLTTRAGEDESNLYPHPNRLARNLHRQMTTSDQDHSIVRWEKGTPRKLKDHISIEAPLQITLRYGKSKQRTTASLAITMRTPGEDFQLASGYLFTENLINQRKDIIQMRHLSQDEVLVELHEDVFIDLTGQNRNTYVNSSCGICGKDSLSEVKATIPYLLAPNIPLVRYHDICGWPKLLDTAQKQFKATGGTHAAALVAQNELVTVHEDVGRHNALDKLMGYALENLALPLRDAAIVVSSRASFELVQKALMGGVPILASIGASTSMAIEMAAENNMTLVGFLKSNQFNVYTHPGRITI